MMLYTSLILIEREYPKPDGSRLPGEGFGLLLAGNLGDLWQNRNPNAGNQAT